LAVLPTTDANESDLCTLLNGWHKEMTGKGCGRAKARVLGNLLVVETAGSLTKHEEALLMTDQGRSTVRRLREVMAENGRDLLERMVSQSLKKPYHLLVYKIDDDFENATVVMVTE
jgi:uncharacterized protein YbcI